MGDHGNFPEVRNLKMSLAAGLQSFGTFGHHSHGRFGWSCRVVRILPRRRPRMRTKTITTPGMFTCNCAARRKGSFVYCRSFYIAEACLLQKLYVNAHKLAGIPGVDSKQWQAIACKSQKSKLALSTVLSSALYGTCWCKTNGPPAGQKADLTHGLDTCTACMWSVL